MTSQRVKNKKSTTRDEVEWRDCCPLHAVTSSVIYYSKHTRGNVIYLFLSNKNPNGLLKDFWGMKKEKQVC